MKRIQVNSNPKPDNGGNKPNYKYFGWFIALMVLLLVVIGIPRWQVFYTGHDKEAKEKQELVNSNRTVAINAVTGAVVIFALVITYRRMLASERQIEIAQGQFITSQSQLEAINKGQFNDRYIRAIELLNNNNSTEVQVAGLLSLRNLCKENENIITNVIELLQTYIEERTHISSQINIDCINEIPNSHINQAAKAFHIILDLTDLKEYHKSIQLSNVYLKHVILFGHNHKLNISFNNCIIHDFTYVESINSIGCYFSFNNCKIFNLETLIDVNKIKIKFSNSVVDNLVYDSLSFDLESYSSIIYLEIKLPFSDTMNHKPFYIHQSIIVLDINYILDFQEKNNTDIINTLNNIIVNEESSIYDFTLNLQDIGKNKSNINLLIENKFSHSLTLSEVQRLNDSLGQ